MPKASHSVQVKAPVETVWRLLVDSIANPAAYLPGISGVRILDRQPGFLIRQMTLGELAVVERVTAFEKMHEVDFVLVDHPVYAGQVVLRIEPPLRPGLSCALSCSLDWRRKDGQPDTLDLQPSIVQAVEKTKALAEQQSHAS
jgi:hypothetical protein